MTQPSDIRLRPAVLGEEQTLSDLCLRSKRHWGYEDDFIKACAPYLKVTTTSIASGYVTVAIDENNKTLGVCQIVPDTNKGSLDLLFIEPEEIGRGIGRKLYDNAKAQLKALGEKTMTILSDPDAEARYIHMGARRIEMRASDVFKGRSLPWLEVTL